MPIEPGTGLNPRVVVFGSLNVDLVCRVRSIARPGETVLAPRYEQLMGGKGANQAVAAARMIGTAGSVAMIGAVGDDALGVAVADNLTNERIDTSGLQTVGERTGCAFIAIDDRGENAITVASGANGQVSAAPLAAAPPEAGAILVLQMEVPVAQNLAAAAAARRTGARTVLNLAPVPSDLNGGDLEELLGLVEVLVVNETELAASAALTGIAVGDAEATAAALGRRHRLTVIATLGADGALIVPNDGAPRHIAALPVDPVDTTGAGDTFVGVFAAGLAEELEMATAAERAVVAASLACRRIGAQSAMPTRQEVEAAVPGAATTA